MFRGALREAWCSCAGPLGRGALAALLASWCFQSSAARAQSAEASQAEIREGLSLLREGQPVEAKVRFDAAVKAAPRSPDALTWRGICENQMQQYAAAVTDFRAALRLNRDLLPAHYNLALSLIRLHETEAAIEQLRVVIAADPKALQALYNLAVLLEIKGAYAEAAERLGVAHELDPQDTGVAAHLLGDRLRATKSADVTALMRDLESDSTPVELQRMAAAELLEANRFAEAATLLRSVRARNSGTAGVDLLLARAEIGEGQNAEALSLLEGAEASDDNEKNYLIGIASLGTGNVRKAAESFAAAAQRDPKDARPAYQLGLLAAQEPGGQQEAVRLMRSAAELDPGNRFYLLGLARVLLATDQADAAKTVLRTIPAADTDLPERHTLTGIAFAATHMIAEAVPELELALKQDPQQALASNVLGFCLFQQGQYGPAAEAYGRASELEPGRALYARDAALAYARADQSGRALHFAERAATASHASGADHALLGKLYATAGENDAAIRELRRAAELDPDLDSAVYLLARTYLKMGDRHDAQEWSARLTALKQKHEAAFNLQKRAEATSIRSSTLLDGGLLQGDETGAP